MKYLDSKRYEGWLIEHSDYQGSRPCDRIDYSYKASILNTDLCKRMGEFSWEFFLNSNENAPYACLSSEELQAYFDSLYDKYGISAILESLRLNNARYHRQSRLRDRILRICNCGLQPYFLTFTFTDDSLEALSPVTSRRYVQRFLKAYFSDYVANVDYGSKKGRLHYHAVACTSWLDPSLWQYGNLDFEKVIVRDDCPVLLSKYIDKLTLHAIKATTKRTSLIYPKHFKKIS